MGGLLDTIIWNGSYNGFYTVKNAYRYATDVLQPNKHFFISSDWHNLWNIEVLYKVRYFALRVAQDCFPYQMNLHRKGIVVPCSCVICDSNMENCWHLFVSCHFAKQVWQ